MKWVFRNNVGFREIRYRERMIQTIEKYLGASEARSGRYSAIQRNNVRH